jgi:hypothetical protein
MICVIAFQLVVESRIQASLLPECEKPALKPCVSTEAFEASAIKRFYMAGEIDHSVISIVKIDRLHNRHRWRPIGFAT